MSEVSTFRLYLMRATYLLIFVGLGSEAWPGIIRHANVWTFWHGIASSWLAAVSVLAFLGIRYPLTVSSLLLFELVWKSIWLIAIALPFWSARQLDPDTLETIKACEMGIAHNA